MKTERKFFIAEVKDEYWVARYNSETNETRLTYDASVALDSSLHSLVRNYIQFKSQDIERVISLLQRLKEESEL